MITTLVGDNQLNQIFSQKRDKSARSFRTTPPPTTLFQHHVADRRAQATNIRKTNAISRWQDVWLRFMARKRTRYVSSRISGVEQMLCTSDGRSCGLSSWLNKHHLSHLLLTSFNSPIHHYPTGKLSLLLQNRSLSPRRPLLSHPPPSSLLSNHSYQAHLPSSVARG